MWLNDSQSSNLLNLGNSSIPVGLGSSFIPKSLWTEPLCRRYLLKYKEMQDLGFKSEVNFKAKFWIQKLSSKSVWESSFSYDHPWILMLIEHSGFSCRLQTNTVWQKYRVNHKCNVKYSRAGGVPQFRVLALGWIPSTAKEKNLKRKKKVS